MHHFDWEEPVLSASEGGVHTVNGVFDYRLTQQLRDESVPSPQPSTDGRSLGVYVGPRMNTPRVFINRGYSAVAEDLAFHPREQEAWLDIHSRMDSLLDDMAKETGVEIPNTTPSFLRWHFTPLYSEEENRPVDLASYLASIHESTMSTFRQAAQFQRDRGERRSTVYPTLPRGLPMLVEPSVRMPNTQ